jgi:DNA-binding MarR family transcriptional regulator
MVKHTKKARSREVAGAFVPISHKGPTKPLTSTEWRKDLVMSWLFQTCIRLQRSLDSRFLRFGMTVQEASALLRCVEARSITPGQLAVGLGRDRGMITRFINRLEQSALLARDINQRDRRFADLKPTAKGKRIARDLAAVFYEVRKELFVGISESEIQRLSNMLARLHKNAADIGSQQKCTAVRHRRRIGVHGVKAASTLSSQPPLVADILRCASPKRRTPAK